MRNLFFTFTVLLFYSFSFAQIPTTYYLSDIEYDANIPSPADFFGHQIGEWHLSHDKQYMYMRELARLSDRVKLVEYARTYEDRPLIYLIITSEENHRNLDKIKSDHVQLSDAKNSKSLDVSNMPSVLYQGFSIHGNEASGGNAAPLVAYYLAAGKGAEVEGILNNVVNLLDPCYNPDGFQRFSTWVNMHKNKNLTSDPQDREYDESWPGGRTNHYWFDLNRDWLPVQHPESQGRIRNFHEWKPNVLTDHHEMGSNSTFFFQPGIPQRTNPITPAKNQELTAKIGNYHAAALDKIGSLYFTQERYDDFYYGKGSTYPDINGGIGILFEQASSRGHLQETVNGNLSFPFTIRNQVTTAISTLKAAEGMREELLNYQRDFYTNAAKAVGDASVQAYVFGGENEQGKAQELLNILAQHQIKTHRLAKDIRVDGQAFKAENAYVVPANQQQYTLIRGIFETSTTFGDSLFYDISSWTFPLAFNIPYKGLSKSSFSNSILGEEYKAQEKKSNVLSSSSYGYLLEWEEYYVPKTLNAILDAGLRAKVATIPFTLEGKDYDYGTIFIPVQNQKMSAEEIRDLLQKSKDKTNVGVTSVKTGLSPEGIDLGSSYFENVVAPKILLVVGEGVSSYDAGEVWHLLDQRYDISISKVMTGDLDNIDMNRYNVVIMVDGYYGNISNTGANNLKDWSEKGGTIIAMKRAVQWLVGKGIANVKFKSANVPDADERRPYAKAEADDGSKVLGGAIFETEIDITNPLFYGYKNNRLPVFRRGTLFFQPTENAYATPSVYTDNPLLGGYIQKDHLEIIKNSAAVVVNANGRGRVICLADNPNFRAFWYGTNKLFANAIFFGKVIDSGAVER